MATKNGPDDLLAEGFSAEQFGAAATADWSTYGQALLDRITETVKERAGATQYASSDPVVAMHVKSAELYLACAQLCRRRVNRIDNSASSGHEDSAVAALLREIRASKAQYEADAEREFAAIPSATAASDSSTSTPGFGAVTSSPFDKSAT